MLPRSVLCSVKKTHYGLKMSNQTCIRRLNKEYSELLTHPEEGVSAGPCLGGKIFPVWDGFIHGPQDSPYEGGIFKLRIIIPREYPFKPPRITFITKIFHCNIGNGGNLCSYHVGLTWSPADTVKQTLAGVRKMLASEPNHECVLNCDLYRMLKNNPEEYHQWVREATRKFAIPQYDFDINHETDSKTTHKEQSHE